MLSVKLKRRLRRCMWGCLLLFALLAASRNLLARIAIEKIASTLLKTDVCVDRVFVGLQVIHLEQLRVPLNGVPGKNNKCKTAESYLTIDQIRILPSLIDGWREGVWVNSVAIKNPKLQLQFDHAGALLTRFPTLTAGEENTTQFKIPLRKILVESAELCICQNDKRFSVIANRVSADFTDAVEINAVVSDLMGSHVTVESRLDLKTLVGRTQVLATPMVIQSRQLARLPFVPEQVGVEPFSFTASLAATIQHPAEQLDFRLHDFEVNAKIQNPQTRFATELSDWVWVQVSNHQAQAMLRLRTQQLGGWCDLTAKSNLLEDPCLIEVDAESSRIQLHRLGSLLSEITKQRVPDCTAELSSSVHATLLETVAGGWQVEATNESKLTKLVADNVSIDDLKTTLTTSWTLDFNDLAQSKGRLSGAYVWDGVSIEKLAGRFGLPQAKGYVKSDGRFTFPLSPSLDFEKLEVLAKTNWQSVQFNGMSIEDSGIQVVARDGVASAGLPYPIRLQDVQGNSLGQVHALAEAALAPDGDIRLQLSAPQLSIADLLKSAGWEDLAVVGTVSCQAIASTKFSKLIDPTAWSADLQLNTSPTWWMDEPLDEVDLVAFFRAGSLEVPQFDLVWKNTRCRIAAAGSLIDRPWVVAKVETPELPLADIGEFANRFSGIPILVEGVGSVTGNLEAKLFPLEFKANGTAQLHEATLQNTRIGSAELGWNADPEKLLISSCSKDFLGGSYNLVATLKDLDWTKTVVAGDVKDLQVAKLTTMVDLPFAATGILNAGFQVSGFTGLNDLQATGWLNSRRLSVERIPAEISAANLNLQGGLISLNSRGEICDGTFSTTVEADVLRLQKHFSESNASLEKLPVTFQANLLNLPIKKLGQCIKLPRELNQLQGFVNGQCYRNEATLDASMLCKLEASVEKVTWNRMQLSERIAAELDVRSNAINLTRIDGRLADGRINGKAELRLDAQPRGSFDFEVARINLRRASGALRLASKNVTGTASLGVSGRIGSTLSGQMALNIDNAVLSDLAVRHVSIPAEWSYSIAANSAKWRCRNGIVETGQGKIYLTSEGSFDRGLTTKSSARIDRVDTARLIRGRSFGAGLVDGTIRIQAKRATSIKQLSGDFDIALSQIQAMEMPVLDQLPSMIQIPSLKSSKATEEGGRFVGRIANGIVSLETSTINQSNINVMLQGRATVDGNLDFDVTASTYQSGPIDDLLSLADSPLMLAGPAPIALLARANEAMKNRVVHVQVTGNANRPILRLQPGKQLSQEALRFFILSNLPTQFADVAESNQFRRR